MNSAYDKVIISQPICYVNARVFATSQSQPLFAFSTHDEMEYRRYKKPFAQVGTLPCLYKTQKFSRKKLHQF